MNELALSDFQVFDEEMEPRVSDLRVAELLGYEILAQIRELIKRNLAELERYGVIRTIRITPLPGSLGGRPSDEYRLTEGQALLVCTRSNADNAPDAREKIIKGFMAWRRGKLPASAKPVNVLDALDLLLVELRTQSEQIFLINGEIVEIKQQIRELQNQTGFLVADRRRSIPRLVIERHVRCLHDLGGRCPCCGKTVVIDNDGNLTKEAQGEHFNRKDDPRIDTTWIVCARCNPRLNNTEFHHRKQAAFDTYQDRRRDFEGDEREKATAEVVELRPLQSVVQAAKVFSSQPVSTKQTAKNRSIPWRSHPFTKIIIEACGELLVSTHGETLGTKEGQAALWQAVELKLPRELINQLFPTYDEEYNPIAVQQRWRHRDEVWKKPAYSRWIELARTFVARDGPVSFEEILEAERS